MYVNCVLISVTPFNQKIIIELKRKMRPHPCGSNHITRNEAEIL